MKKIITLAFSIGILSSAFAQSGHRQPDKNSGNNYKQSQYSRDNHQVKPNSNTTFYNRNSQWNNKGNEYAYNKNDRGRNEHFAPQYNYERKAPVYYQPARVPLLQIIFGIGGR